LLHRIADHVFVEVALGGIEVAKAGLQRRRDRPPGRRAIGDQRAESDGWHRAPAVRKRNTGMA